MTLPILQTLEPLYIEALTNPTCPDVEVRNYDWFTLNFGETYTLDIRILSQDRVMLTDSAYKPPQAQERQKGSPKNDPQEKTVISIWSKLQQQLSLQLPNKPRRGGTSNDKKPPLEKNEGIVILTRKDFKYLETIIDSLR